MKLAVLTVCALFVATASAVASFNKVKRVVTSDNLELLLKLIDEKVDVNMVGPTCQKSLLTWAVIKGAKQTFKALLDNGADPNIRDKGNGMTPMMYAVTYDRPEMVSMLMKYEADKEKRDNSGMSAMDYAMQTNNVDIQDLLR